MSTLQSREDNEKRWIFRHALKTGNGSAEMTC